MATDQDESKPENTGPEEEAAADPNKGEAAGRRGPPNTSVPQDTPNTSVPQDEK